MSRERNIETVRNFVNLFEQRKILEVSELFAEEGKIIHPYHSGIVPFEIVGKKNIYDFWKNTSDNFDEIKFPIDEIMPFEDPNKVAVKLSGKLKFKNKSGTYENVYLFLFNFDENSKILETHEYFNPVIAAKAFGLMDKLCK